MAVFNTSKHVIGVHQHLQVLELSAAKSSCGHAEPAAGAVGMLRAMYR